MDSWARIPLSTSLGLILAVSAVSAQTSKANDAPWAKECSTLLQGGAPADQPAGILPQRLEEMARGQSHAGQHFVACSLYLWAAADESSAGNAAQGDTDKSMAKVEQKLGAGEKLGFVDKMNHTAEVLEEAEKPGAAPTQSEIDAIKSALPQSSQPQTAQATPGPAAPASSPVEAPANQSAAASNPAGSSAPAIPAPAPVPAGPATPTPAPAPAAEARASAQPAGDEGQSRAAGVKDWSKIDGYYVCYYFGYTGGSHYVGGFAYPNLGLLNAGIGLTISSHDDYSSNRGGAGTFSFSSMVPGQAKPEMLGTISFVSGSLTGRRALLQTHQQFQHAIIFPAKWKKPDGTSVAFSPSDTWCYQKH